MRSEWALTRRSHGTVREERQRGATGLQSAGCHGPPEGDPGSTITITITDVFPPLVIVATVQDDGWFTDDVYDQIAAARAQR